MTNHGSARGDGAGADRSAGRRTGLDESVEVPGRRHRPARLHRAPPAPRSRSASRPATTASPPTTRPSSRSPNRAASGSRWSATAPAPCRSPAPSPRSPACSLRLRTPQTYKASDPGDQRPAGARRLHAEGRPARRAGAARSSHPPRFPGGTVRGKMNDSRMSGTEAASPLLDGVDLASLTIGAGRLAAAGAARLVQRHRLELGRAADRLRHRRRPAGRDDLLRALRIEPAAARRLPDPDRQHRRLVAAARPAERRRRASRSTSIEPPGTTAASVAPAAGGEAETLDRRRRAPKSRSASPRPATTSSPSKGRAGTRELTVAVNPGADPGGGRPGRPLRARRRPPTPATPTWWKWLLVAALVVLILEAPTTPGGANRCAAARRRRRLIIGLQVASLVLVAVALFDPTSGSSPPPTTLVLDRSLSVGPRSAEAEAAWLKANEGCGSDCHVVQFGGGAELTGAGTEVRWRAKPRAASKGGRTNLQGALELALARTPRGGRVVLLSDGRQTTGEPLGLAAAARERGVALDTVALNSQPVDAAVTRLAGAGGAARRRPALDRGDGAQHGRRRRPGSSSAATASSIGHQGVELGEGDNPFLFSVRGAAPHRLLRVRSHGPQRTRLRARRTTPGDDGAGLDRAQGPRRRRRRVGRGGTDEGRRLRRHHGVAERAAEHRGGLRRHRRRRHSKTSPTKNSAKRRAEAIGEAVRDRALGLLALGGEHSFSLGKYYKSPLQEVLPVKSLVPGKLQRKNVAIELVLDRSGSMINEVGGVPKIAQAQAAARGAVEFLLKHRDEVGIVTFEIKPHTLVPLTRVEPGTVGGIQKKINTIPANGGTNIYKGLERGGRRNREIESQRPPHHPADRRDQRTGHLRRTGAGAEKGQDQRRHGGARRGSRLQAC